MNSIIDVVKQNIGLIASVAAIFFLIGFLLPTKSIQQETLNPDLQGALFGIHFFKDGQRPKVITSRGERIEPNENDQESLKQESGKQSAELDRVPGGRILANHNIRVIGKEGSINFYIKIDGITYCFKLDNNFNVIGGC